MKQVQVRIPALGNVSDVEVIEIAVAVGAAVTAEQTLLTLESDKASLEVPAPQAGTVRAIHLKVGDHVSEGDLVLDLEVAGGASAAEQSAAPVPEEPVRQDKTAVADTVEPDSGAASPVAAPAPGGETMRELVIPDLGNVDEVEVIEVSVQAGEHVEEGDALIVLESDKASMEVPAPASGELVALTVKVGDRVGVGHRIGTLRTRGQAAPVAAASKPAAAAGAPVAAPSLAGEGEGDGEGDGGVAISRVFEQEQRRLVRQQQEAPPQVAKPAVYAGPAVRQFARELGVDLPAIAGSGRKGRIRKEDVQDYVKAQLAAGPSAALPTIPEVDFAAFGPIETVALNAVQKATVTSMSRSWLNVPHVTQFDLADVSELEAFRDGLRPEMQARDNKLTLLPFILLAVARALREHPRFSASLAADGASLVMKKYCHVGIAVDTPQGLVVPVMRDVDRKSIWEIASEARELAERARNRKLKLADMQGGCFTVSSLGRIGGEGFTPIVNAPEVAILGVSKLAVRPVWNGSEFVPRQTLPLALSYDHRVINGADAGEFLTFLVGLLSDIRRLLL